MQNTVNCSIVAYKHSCEEILSVIQCINKSRVNKIFIIDNSPVDTLKEIKKSFNNIEYVFNDANLGYGIAHNIALRESINEDMKYHVVLNPDISFEHLLLDRISVIMDKNPDYGQLMPKVVYENGNLQYLCRLIPSPFDYICKRYIPFKWAKKKADKFMLKFTGYNKIMNVPILSGCFMFFRVSALKDIGLFDERYFMYPEDDDITRRMHVKYKTIYYPYLSIQHGYESAPYKSIKMHFILIKNMIKYFNKWGWFMDKERKRINQETLKELNYEK